MPFYDYRCTKGHEFEVRQSMSDEPLTECEVCGASASRVLTAPAIHFKGSGFHNTDYVSKRRSGGDDGGSSNGDGGSSNGAGTAKDGASSSSAGSGSSSDSGGSTKTVGLDKV